MLRSQLVRLGFAGAVVALSLLPLALAVAPQAVSALARVPVVGDWYATNVIPVEERRPLADFPAVRAGGWLEIDQTYRGFERWFGDHLGLRDLMIRAKNELDYRVFRSSARVYYGRRRELYGRNIVDHQVPATEALLSRPRRIERVHAGMVRYAETLRAQGVTAIFIAPMQKQHFYARLPLFAPRPPQPSRFMELYDRLKADPRLHFVDVYGILKSLQEQKQLIFYRQDFHWTPTSAHAVARDAVHRIAALEGSSLRWERPIELVTVPFQGSETRFAGRLNALERVDQPILGKIWRDTHVVTPLDAARTGLEFETPRSDAPGLLPATCLHGNSFSDYMVDIGIADHFTSFTRVDRTRSLAEVPQVIRGRCRYLIVQILDIQTPEWEWLSS